MTAVAEWDRLNRDVRSVLRWPSEHVIRWLSQFYPVTYKDALDIGSGFGRHSLAMEDLGFNVTRCDFSPTSLSVVKADMTRLPFPDESFDVALAFGVFYYGSRTDHLKAVSEMHRVLRPCGNGFVCIRSDRDWRFDADMDGEPEQGMKLDFVTESELQGLYGGFSEWSYESAEWTTHERKRFNSDWLITVRR